MKFCHTPGPNYCGEDSFTFTVNDGWRDSEPATVTITVGDGVALSVGNLPAGYVHVSHNGFTTGTANNWGGTANKLNLQPDYQAGPLGKFYYPTTGGNLSQLLDTGSRSSVAAELSQHTTRTDQTPDADTVDIGFHYVALEPPTAYDGSAQTCRNSPVEFDLSGSSPQGYPLTYAVTSGPDHGTLVRNGAHCTYTPSLDYCGEDSFTFTVNDGWRDSDAATVYLQVGGFVGGQNQTVMARADSATRCPRSRATASSRVIIFLLQPASDFQHPNKTTMTKHSSLRLTALVAVGLITSQASFAAGPRTLSRDVLRDKIRGAWAGQMIGVAYGAPTEFKSLGKIIENDIKGEPLKNAITQDDLYVEMTFARVMDTVGLDATTADYGEAFKHSQYELWHANAGARRNLNRGIAAPMSGHPHYNLHADDIDFQIEADFIGIMCPGLPQTANQYCDRVGRVMNYGDGLYGGMFVCGMYSAAYFETDPRKVVEAGLAGIPAGSSYAKLVSDLLAWSAKEPDDWRKVWQQMEDKWNQNDPCPDGAFRAFNIDAKLNGAYIAIGLLYGKGDWQQTMEIATRCGQDSDCNPSSALGVLGAMIGYANMPESCKLELDKIADTKFSFTDYSYNDIVKSTEVRALQAIVLAGGRVSETEVVIPAQTPKAPPLEQCDFGVPTKVLWVKDPAWNWSTNWEEKAAYIWADKIDSRVAAGPGFETTLKFTGTGVALVGDLSQSGGRADVYLDGVKSELVADAYIVPRTHDNDLWHVHGLKPGEHTLRLVMRDDADERSKGKKLTLSRAIIYDARPPTPTQAVIRISAGAETDFTDSIGNVWLSDRGFEGGDVVTRAADMEIENTKDAALYRTEHWGMSSFTRSLPNGNYVVKLHFAETWEGIEGPGERVFSFNVEGRELKDFDVWVKASGGQRAYIEEVPVTIADGKLDITFESGVDNPEINGIEIIPAP